MTSIKTAVKNLHSSGSESSENDEEHDLTVSEYIQESAEHSIYENSFDGTRTERDLEQITLIGPELHQKIQDCKLFMVGAGAIGCELLKNYAMLGIG